MTQFRSQTDEQLAARWDTEPWRDLSTGNRAAKPPSPILAIVGKWEFAPRVECIPSRDPEPFVRTYNGTEPKRVTPEYASQTKRRYENSFGEIVVTQWHPRPEYARPPVNRVLTKARGWMKDGITTSYGSALWKVNNGGASGTVDEYNHARKVLERLAAL